MKRQTTKISIETHERIIVRPLPDTVHAFCASCQDKSVFQMPESVAVEFDFTTREIFRLVEKGTLHFLENKDGLTLICKTSLEIFSGRAASSQNRIKNLPG